MNFVTRGIRKFKFLNTTEILGSSLSVSLLKKQQNKIRKSFSLLRNESQTKYSSGAELFDKPLTREIFIVAQQ